MCGIVGWVDIKNNIENEMDVLCKMMDTLSMRGPDGSGVYKSKNALLGHRRLAVVDPEGGAQPMSRRLGGNVYTAVYNGELYNTEEIRRLLIDKGYKFKSYSDTEVLLTSYMEWGEDCVKYFNGIFAFAVWNEGKKELFLARDPLGVKPLFYSQKKDFLLFASEIKAILANPMIEPVVDRRGLTEVFGLGPARPLGSGVFKYIEEVKPGYCIIFNCEGMKSKQYWKLESMPYEEKFETTVEHVRSLLIDAVERQLVADVPLCTFLSGGLDSSAISAIASNSFKRDGRGNLNTYSIDYTDNEKFFKSNEFQPDLDVKWAKKMVDFIGSTHYNIMINTQELASALKSAVLANDLPGMADIDSSLYLFCREVRRGAVVALSGECADEIFGGYPWYTRNEDINSNTFPWSRSVTDRKRILSKEFKDLPIEDYAAGMYEETIKEVPVLVGESAFETRMRQLFYLNIKWFMITLLNRKDRMSMSNSLEVRVPFADYRIVEYAFNIPSSVKLCDGREKGLLRRAMRGILPDSIIDRKKSPYPKTFNPEYLKAVQSWMSEILRDPNSPLLPLIDKNTVWEIVESGGKSFTRPWYGQLMTGPQLIAYLIQIDVWLKQYNVKII